MIVIPINKVKELFCKHDFWDPYIIGNKTYKQCKKCYKIVEIETTKKDN